jgi:hypothetical protein
MNYRQAARMEAERHVGGPLPVRTVCPICLGGNSHEESFVVWESDGNIFATCHRARCELGTVLVKGSLGVPDREEFARAKDKDYMVALTQDIGVPLGDADFAYLKRKCGEDSYLYKRREVWRTSRYIQGYPKWAEGDATSGGLVLPMHDSFGQVRGNVIKPYPEHLPVSLTYKGNPDYDGMSWYLTHSHMGEGTVFIVEDGLSALTILGAMERSAVSLNGTLLNISRVRRIFTHNKLAYLCLDADATSKALQYALTFGSQYNIKVIRLERDFKNMSAQELTDFFTENNLC